MKKSILSISILSLLFTACKKDNDQPADITPTVQNIAGSYKLEKITTKTGTAAETPVTDDLLEPCQKDDIYKLNVDMTFQYQDIGTVCDPSESFITDWNLYSSTSIQLDGYTYTIRRFNGKNLELTEQYGDATLVTYFIKQ